jgi:hypothetical protein
MFKLESLDFTTNYTELKENVEILKDSVLFNQITLNIEYVDYKNVFDREIVEIVSCDDSYCVTIYDYFTKDLVVNDMYFENLTELIEYIGNMYFDEREDEE